jgi:hypothetical protein
MEYSGRDGNGHKEAVEEIACRERHCEQPRRQCRRPRRQEVRNSEEEAVGCESEDGRAVEGSGGSARRVAANTESRLAAVESANATTSSAHTAVKRMAARVENGWEEVRRGAVVELDNGRGEGGAVDGDKRGFTPLLPKPRSARVGRPGEERRDVGEGAVPWPTAVAAVLTGGENSGRHSPPSVS